MAVEIIPAILEKDFPRIKERILEIEPYVFWAQLDVVDGVFAPNVTWNNPLELRTLQTALKLEIDLMIMEPEKYIDAWVASGASRIFFHAEATKNAEVLIRSVQEGALEVGMSINPATPPDVLYEFIPKLDAVLLLGVEPGFQGQTFHEDVIEKVKTIHEKFPEIPIEVDGGIRPGIARRLVAVGASRIIAGSSIFGDGVFSVNKNIQDLTHDTNL